LGAAFSDWLELGEADSGEDGVLAAASLEGGLLVEAGAAAVRADPAPSGEADPAVVLAAGEVPGVWAVGEAESWRAASSARALWTRGELLAGDLAEAGPRTAPVAMPPASATARSRQTSQWGGLFGFWVIG
jgi:hypothetical protein